MISHEKKFIFVHIPRTGGTHLSKYLVPYCDDESLIFSPYSAGGISNLHATMYDYTEYYGKSILEYNIFTIIRNPYDRILSHAFQHNNGVFEREHFKELALSPWSLGMIPHSHFNYFLNDKFVRDPGATDHTVIFMRSVPPGGLRYMHHIIDWPFFLEFEKYGKQVPNLLDRLGIKYDANEFKKKTNNTTHDHYSHYYEEDEKQAILEMCGLDLQMFGYRFEDQKNT